MWNPLRYFNFVARAFRLVTQALPDSHFRAALDYIDIARSLWTKDGVLDQEKAREYVVKMLVNEFHIPESLARCLLEIAYQVYKDRYAS